MKRILWWICLFLAPAVLIGLELFHPANFTAHPGMYQYLSQAEPHSAAHHHALDYFGPRWWLVLHMIQTPMVGLVAVGLLLMVDGIGDEDGAAAVAAVWLARAAIFVMVIYFTVLDAIGGIGLGRTILTVQSLAAAGKLSPQQVEGAALLLNTLWVDPSGRRRRLLRQRDRVMGGLRCLGVRCRGPAAVASRRLGQHGSAGGLRLGSCRWRMPRHTGRSPSRS